MGHGVSMCRLQPGDLPGGVLYGHGWHVLEQFPDGRDGACSRPAWSPGGTGRDESQAGTPATPVSTCSKEIKRAGVLWGGFVVGDLS